MVKREIQSLGILVVALSLIAQTQASANPAGNQNHNLASAPSATTPSAAPSTTAKALGINPDTNSAQKSAEDTGINNNEPKDKFGFPILTKSDSDAISKQTADIHGIHPIKRALQPIVNMQAVIVKLQLQVMQLAKPIADLQPPMAALDSKATAVDSGLVKMIGRMSVMEGSMDGIRSDLTKVEAKINRLVGPVQRLQEPVIAVSKPLMQIDKQLTYIQFAILGSVFLICIGVPVMAMLLFVYRNKFFKHAA